MSRVLRYLFALIFFVPLYFWEIKVYGEAGPSIRYTVFNKKRFVYLRDIASYYGFSCWVEKNRTLFSVKNKKWQVVFYHDKKEVDFNGIKLYLLKPAFNRSIQSYISEKDFWLTIDPLLRANARKQHPVKTIVIDPGHGGKDLGGNNNLGNEKDIVLQTARRTVEQLRRRGYNAVMTRTEDINLGLKERVNIASRLGASLFISIHNNMAPSSRVSGSIQGVETFCLTPAGESSTHGGASQSYMTGNRNDRNNILLAYEIHRAIISQTQSNDRGIKRARFLVLKEISCPAILVETGFLSHPREGSRLLTRAHQNAVATGIADGVSNYHRAIQQGK